MDDSGKYYILMADVIKSRNQSGQKLMVDFKKLIDELKKDHKDSFLSPPTITLGDEFQSIVSSLNAGVKSIIAIEETIIKQNFEFKLRYVLHYGSIDTWINHESAYEMLGNGLTRTRELLSELKRKNNRIFIQIPIKQGDILNNLFKLFSFKIDKWKRKDYTLISQFIQGKDYKMIASDMEKERSAIWRKEKSLQIEQYLVIKRLISQIVEL